MTTTSEVLAGMMKENTGSHFLDSGGSPRFDSNGNYVGSEHGYGRNHERNQLRSFEQEPASAVKFEVWGGRLEISFAHNTFHWLNNRCELDETLDDLFHGQFREERDADDSKGWLELMEEFPVWLALQTDEDGNLIYGEPAGIYGEGELFTVNTYNHESLLDQTIQFTYFTNEAGEFIALQIHGGADVRGGYTRPRIFSVGHQSELDIFDDQRAGIFCTGKDRLPRAEALKNIQEKQLTLKGIDTPEIDFEPEYPHNWSTDDGYHWYFDGGTGDTQLEQYEVRDLDDEDEGVLGWEPGILCVQDGVGYCPICGARLEASEY
jgi:hypothetical protein